MNPGDVVRLKSSGPSMTVESVQGSYAHCAWFDEKNKPQDKDFLLVTLAKDDDEDAGSVSFQPRMG
jgi:uncharacterized protein YodC (DUF2158 family)